MLRSSERPVYVLGAGFSKAVHDAMPITNELGTALRHRLVDQVEIDLSSGQSFEQWLSLQLTAMPFLRQDENDRRRADAGRVVAEIATVLDGRVEEAASERAPLWLRQLVTLWHQEKAVVLTLNYDTLVERAVNASGLAVGAGSSRLRTVLGDHVTFPAPLATEAQTLGDMGSQHTQESLQLVKLHGSLNWYWTSNDTVGTTMQRRRVKESFGGADDFGTESDFDAITALERYLIPPTTSKDDYYGSVLTTKLWRTAGAALAASRQVTLLGYSLPFEDKITAQLLVQASAASFEVVDRSAPLGDASSEITSRLRALQLDARDVAGGALAIPDYVAARLAEASSKLSHWAETNDLQGDVFAAIGRGWNAHTYVLSRTQETEVFTAHRINETRHPEVPRTEDVRNEMARGMAAQYEFLRGPLLRELVRDGGRVLIRHPDSNELLTATGASLSRLGRFPAVFLQWAPVAD